MDRDVGRANHRETTDCDRFHSREEVKKISEQENVGVAAIRDWWKWSKSTRWRRLFGSATELKTQSTVCRDVSRA